MNFCPFGLPGLPRPFGVVGTHWRMGVTRGLLAALVAALPVLAAPGAPLRTASPVAPVAPKAPTAPAAPAGPAVSGESAAAPPPPVRRLSLELIETLPQSIELRRVFPFQPNCNGNTKEMLACLWQQRDRQDQRLQTLLGSATELELWRGVRQRLCRRAAERGAGGSIAPLLGLECELALTTTLLDQIALPARP